MTFNGQPVSLTPYKMIAVGILVFSLTAWLIHDERTGSLLATMTPASFEASSGTGEYSDAGHEALLNGLSNEHDAAPMASTLRLLRTRESRQSLENDAPLEATFVGTEGGPPHGNWLAMDLTLENVPAKSRLVSVEIVSASVMDDIGTDLLAAMVKDVGANPKSWTDRSLLMHDTAPSVRWFVAVPPRRARTIDATLIVRMRVAASKETIVLAPTSTWTKIESPSLEGLSAEARWSSPSGMGPYLDIRPRGVEELVYFIAPRPPQFRGRAHYTSADRIGTQFLLAKGTPEGADVTLQILADITTVEATLTLNGHALPGE